MENYKTRLQEQKEALEKDVEKYVNEIIRLEHEIEFQKHCKILVFRELRSIEKKLAKL